VQAIKQIMFNPASAGFFLWTHYLSAKQEKDCAKQAKHRQFFNMNFDNLLQGT